jgi:serine protease inhibitor
MRSSILFLGLLFWSIPVYAESPTPATADEVQTLVRGYNEFAFRLFHQLHPSKENVLCSPYNLAELLILFHEGAKGTTRQELAQLLGVDKLDERTLIAAHTLREKLRSAQNPQVTFNTGNAIWLRPDLQLQPKYAQTVQQLTPTQINTVNFADPEVIPQINRWVADLTRNKIPEFVSRADVPANTIYALECMANSGAGPCRGQSWRSTLLNPP